MLLGFYLIPTTHPRTYLGKLIGGFTAISGIFILTLPIPIVVNSFASYYKAGLETQFWKPIIFYFPKIQRSFCSAEPALEERGGAEEARED